MAWPFRRRDNEWQRYRGEEEERYRRPYGGEGYEDPEREFRDYEDEPEYGRYAREREEIRPDYRRHGPRRGSFAREGEYGGSWREREREREREPRQGEREYQAGTSPYGPGREERTWRERDRERWPYGGGTYYEREQGRQGMRAQSLERRDPYGWNYPAREMMREGEGGTTYGPGMRTFGMPWGREQEEIRREGFAGRGPSRYQRSDQKIYEEINDRLTDDPAVDATDIEVTVDRCEVTLKGFVPTREQKRIAEDVAEFVSGVKNVHNQLRVDPERSRQRGGAWTSGQVSQTGSWGQSAQGSQWSQGQTSQDFARRVTPGMPVMDAEGQKVGEVKEIHGDLFHLDRPMKRDLLAPFSAVERIHGNQIFLSAKSDDLDELGWQSPELMGVGPEPGEKPSRSSRR